MVEDVIHEGGRGDVGAVPSSKWKGTSATCVLGLRCQRSKTKVRLQKKDDIEKTERRRLGSAMKGGFIGPPKAANLKVRELEKKLPT